MVPFCERRTRNICGDLAFLAVGGNGMDYSCPYAVNRRPGEGHSNYEQGDQGGYEGATGTMQTGAKATITGTVTLGAQSRPVFHSKYDRDLH